MKRLLFCEFCVLLVLTAVGCAKSTLESGISSVSDGKSNKDSVITEENTNYSSENKIELPDSFSFSMTMNVFDYDDNLKCIGYKTNITKDEEKRYSLSVRVIPDQSMDYNIIPVKLLIIADGRFIPFSADGNEEKLLQNTIQISPGADTTIAVNFTANADMRYITIVACALPEDVPDLGIGLYSGVCTYTVVNNNEAECVMNTIDSENYFEVAATEDNSGLGIDIKSLQERQQSTSSEYDKDIIYNKNTDNLWVKFNADASLADADIPLSAYYSLFVLCDGEPTPIFNGEYLHTVHTPAEDAQKSCKTAFQFQISNEYIPNDGLHTFQAIAVPYYIADIQEVIDDDPNVLRGLSTFKTRVIIK